MRTNASILAAAGIILLSACSGLSDMKQAPVSAESCNTIVFKSGDFIQSRSSSDPDEMKISDMNIFIFNRDGLLEQKIYLRASEFENTGKGPGHTVRLLKDCRYSIYACANTGFPLKCNNLQELLEYRFHLAYPDDYRQGMPMSGLKKDYTVKDDEDIYVPLKRNMSKVSLRIDRSRLDKDVEFNVRNVVVHGCPKSINMFGASRAESEDDVFITGFNKTENGVSPLNRNTQGQTSGEISLYMLENLQGKPLGETHGYEDKFFEPGDPMAKRCSYIELTADYISDDYYSIPGKGLVYRFYLGEGPSDFNVERNCHYHITVIPEGSGLTGSGWRVDKRGLEYKGETYMKISPGNYIQGKIGDRIHVRCEYKPSFAPFDIGIEELEYDKRRGIYDYSIDDDGKGVVLTLKGSGSGLLYMEAGEPVNDSAVIVVVVDQP